MGRSKLFIWPKNFYAQQIIAARVAGKLFGMPPMRPYEALKYFSHPLRKFFGQVDEPIAPMYEKVA